MSLARANAGRVRRRGAQGCGPCGLSCVRDVTREVWGLWVLLGFLGGLHCLFNAMEIGVVRSAHTHAHLLVPDRNAAKPHCFSPLVSLWSCTAATFRDLGFGHESMSLARANAGRVRRRGAQGCGPCGLSCVRDVTREVWGLWVLLGFLGGLHCLFNAMEIGVVRSAHTHAHLLVPDRNAAKSHCFSPLVSLWSCTAATFRDFRVWA